MGQSLAEFTMKWSHWQQECKHCLDNETYAGNEHLQKICQVGGTSGRKVHFPLIVVR